MCILYASDVNDIASCPKGSATGFVTYKRLPAPVIVPFYTGSNSNCYRGHGAEVVSWNNPTVDDEASCATMCDANNKCTCFVFGIVDRKCYLRANCKDGGDQNDED